MFFKLVEYKIIDISVIFIKKYVIVTEIGRNCTEISIKLTESALLLLL